MSASEKIPATIVTGFLGAGKTTLLTRLIQQADGKRIALIVNEFGDLGFDGSLLGECGDPECKPDEVIELTNGCICCTVADDFLPTMEALLARDPAPDHILIETSGLALPQPLVRAFQWPSVRSRVTVNGVVTVADSAALSEGRVANDHHAVDAQRAADDALDHESAIGELFEDQLRCADLVVMSKVDLVDTEGRDRALKAINADIRPNVRVVAAASGGFPASVILGLDAAAENDMESRRSHHDDDHDHDHDDFVSFVADAPVAGSLDALKERIGAAMALDGVLRIKGLAQVEGKAAPAIVQAVGPRVDAYFAPFTPEAAMRLVVIGEHDMDQDAIRKTLGG